jgi:glycosyltransferase involved in cell wall biosynthesis
MVGKLSRYRSPSRERRVKRPLVSIISPTFNHERFIGPCIESVLSQTDENWEMIVVDDGSTDHTWEIVTQFAGQDSRIRAFRQENRGLWRLAETYNFALGQSRGDLLAVLEGDDVWAHDKLAVQVPPHISSGCPLSFGRVHHIDENGLPMSAIPLPRVDLLPFLQEPDSTDLVVRYIRGEYLVPALTVVISRDPLVRIGGFQQTEYLPLVDYPTWIRIGARDGGFCFVDHPLGYFRQTSRQASWVHGRQIAQGAYRFAQEMVASGQLSPDVSSRLLGDNTQADLLSANRRDFLTNASYRAAVVAWDGGERRRSFYYCLETARFGPSLVFPRCFAMMGWKAYASLKRKLGRIVRRLGAGKPV